MAKRRTLLWLFPLLAVASYALVTISMRVLTNQEQAYQTARTGAWTTTLQEYGTGVQMGSLGLRKGEMIMDAGGRIWVAGNPSGLMGLHVFDGTAWTSYEGFYADLALGLQDQVWAAGYDLTVIQEGQLTTYGTADLGIKHGDIDQVEVDSNGRIWVTVSYGGDAQVAEIVIQQGSAKAVFSHPEFTITSGAIVSLDTDNAGRVWASVQYFRGEPGTWAGLNVFDGQNWQHMLDLSDTSWGFQRTRVDAQGRIWTVEEGDVMRFNGMDWENLPDICCFDDFSLDSQGNVWGWGYNFSEKNFIKSFNDGGSLTLNPENSSLMEYDPIFGVVVDKLDRLWVGTGRGVSMVPVSSALTIPDEKTVQSHQTYLFLLDRLDGMEWFLPGLFVFLWLAAALDILPGVLLPAALGLLGKMLLPGGVTIFILVLPFTVLGMLFGLVGGLIDKGRSKRGKKGKPWGYILAGLGMLIGVVLGYFFIIITSP